MKVVWCLGAAVPNPFLASLWIGSGLGWPEGDLGRQLPDPRLLSYDSYDLPDAESEREIVRILFFFHFDLIGRTVYVFRGEGSGAPIFILDYTPYAI